MERRSFAAVHPELIHEWSEKNGALTAEDITYGSNKLVWWKGECGHEWQASPKSRSQGEGCPICSGDRIVAGLNDLATLRPDLLVEWSPKNVLKPTEVGVGSHKAAVWVDKLGHEWTAEIRTRATRGTGCPYCSHNKLLPGFNDLETVAPEVAAEWSSSNLPLLPNQVMPFANKKVGWCCKEGHEWFTLISIRTGGSKCPYCSGLKLLKGFNDVATLHPELIAEWSPRNYPLTLREVNARYRKYVWWICPECGYEWRSLIGQRVNGLSCPVCADRRVVAGHNDFQTTDPEIAAEWDVEKNKGVLPITFSRSSLRFGWWRGKCGHNWRMRVSDRTIEGKACPQCREEFHGALPRLLAQFYARQLGEIVEFDTDEPLGIPLEIYFPGLALAFEIERQGNRRERGEQQTKAFMCGKRNIKYETIPSRAQNDGLRIAEEVKRAFAQAHIYTRGEPEKIVKELWRGFLRWKQER